VMYPSTDVVIPATILLITASLESAPLSGLRRKFFGCSGCGWQSRLIGVGFFSFVLLDPGQ
jgi:hypothetical protein